MKLTYRGIHYETDRINTDQLPAVPATDLSYRGVKHRMQQATQVKALNAILTYRGVTYSTQAGDKQIAVQPAMQPPTVASVVPTAHALSVDDQARMLTMNHHREAKNRQQAMLSRSAAAVGLTADVGTYWNHIRGEIHPSFWVTYDRSHVALS